MTVSCSSLTLASQTDGNFHFGRFLFMIYTIALCNAGVEASALFSEERRTKEEKVFSCPCPGGGGCCAM